MEYPDDDIGDVFRRMEASKFDFSKEHIVDFYAVFATEDGADRVARMFVADECRYTNIETRPYDEGGMELEISKKMLVTYDSICELQELLAERVGMVRGYLDGWGVMQD
ncbi:ribonuclease E inhibitor RraB [Grimontia indica]|uniref:ribonuclease E inhibitor RraB n=1 Tax=Grimontia indica TaxID=1056512 RepID=UPI0005877E03|nr:ribonuclease E inhibitor RraB [Grimontia indica]